MKLFYTFLLTLFCITNISCANKERYSYRMTRPATEAPAQGLFFNVPPAAGLYNVSDITFTTTEEQSLSEKEAFEKENKQNALLADLIRNGKIHLSFQEEELEEAVFERDDL